jgi:hypothetical protein
MFLKKDDKGRAMFGSFLNHVSFSMLVHAVDDPFGKEMGVDYRDIVLCRIAELIICLILHDLGDVVKPARLYPMMKVYGVDWKANAITAWHVIKACNDNYAGLGIFVELVNEYLATLEHVNKDNDDWWDAECIFCFELLTPGRVGMMICGHLFNAVPGQITARLLIWVITKLVIKDMSKIMTWHV